MTILNSMMAFQCARDGLYAMANECLPLLHGAHWLDPTDPDSAATAFVAFNTLTRDQRWVDAAIQMIDVHFPTTDGRTLILSRYTALSAEQKMLVQQLKLDLPPQPRHVSAAPGKAVRPQPKSCSGDFHYAAVDIIHFFVELGKLG